MNDWEKVEQTPSEIWEYEKEGDELVGTYNDKEINVGPNESTLLSIKTEEGITKVWSNSVLDTQFKEIELGTDVRIVYEGKVTSDKTGREYKNFSVYTKKN